MYVYNYDAILNFNLFNKQIYIIQKGVYNIRNRFSMQQTNLSNNTDFQFSF